ncbi:SMI1/KNR4 family protein [Gordonia sp. OPL2]|uniref:SMI1/KNR4 family protein n=1 Tax=Gordonia sp. OPL2 TaxID=2486274 RepID=UPI0016556A5A|nr:SMI1/KNR4 family protein [Gordonia sp. OPL2]RPA06162.1 SMI1/KNR4 family protein [Gordonia sp. OPL2]
MKFTDGPVLWTSDEVEALEERIGNPLPADYRGDLLTLGGGSIAERIVPDTGDNGSVHTMLTPHDEQILRDGISTQYEVIPGRYHPVTLGDGGAFCIGLADDVAGQIYWADFDEADELGIGEGNPPSEQIMHLRYPDWRSFVEDLETFELI